MELERRILEKVLPASLFARIDIENTSIRRFLSAAAREIPPGARALDAAAGRCQYRALFPRQKYTAVDSAQGEVAWTYRDLDVLGKVEALPIASARLQVAGINQNKTVAAGDKAAVFRVKLPAGRTTLQTWFADAGGKELCGAYYVYVKRGEVAP